MLKNGNVMDTNTITCLSKAILYFMALLESNQDTNIKKDVIKSKKIDIVSEKELNKEEKEEMSEKITLTIPKKKNIALIAHDGKKAELIKWCKDNSEILKRHFLCGTGTTARMIADATDLPVRGYNSGPLGGDQQIGAKIVEGKIDFVIFFSDPLTAAPHDPDVKALMRIAQVYDIPFANNKATADFMINSTFMEEEYDHDIINFQKNIEQRAETLPNA
ncbi:MAG: methylglyoxal synthase [Methanobrevibacter sp.]|nr:methylglyoxal synthase [Methanobrevibacter sp.]